MDQRGYRQRTTSTNEGACSGCAGADRDRRGYAESPGHRRFRYHAVKASRLRPQTVEGGTGLMMTVRVLVALRSKDRNKAVENLWCDGIITAFSPRIS